jgi:hypothetical protein
MEKRAFVILVISILFISMISHYFFSQTGYLTYNYHPHRFSRTSLDENVRYDDTSSLSKFPEQCNNGVDDDEDGNIDCEDPDCDGQVGGPFGEICEFGTELTCNDLFDNDADGPSDCNDIDCHGLANCGGVSPEICYNGIDDDLDGLEDCYDPDCDDDPSCQILPFNVYHTSPHADNPDIIPLYDIFEMTIRKEIDYGLQENFKDVTLTVDFTSPTSQTATIGGFFYYTLKTPVGSPPVSLWKTRFAPNEVGLWTYSYTLTHVPSGTTNTGTGSFTVISSNLPGFIYRNPDNDVLLEFSNGEPYFPIGINQDARLDEGDRTGAFARHNGYMPTHAAIIGAAEVTGLRFKQLDRWLVICKDESSNQNTNDCEDYIPEPAIEIDQIMMYAHDEGMYPYYGIFGNMKNTNTFPPTIHDDDKFLIEYSINRWGAYVGMWQINNEKTPSNTWTYQVADYIKQYDTYYQHVLSESWGNFPIPSHQSIDMSGPHWYYNENPLVSDIAVKNEHNTWKGMASPSTKPILVGETGTKGAASPSTINFAWHPDSGVRNRIKLWTALSYHDIFYLFKRPETDANGGVYLGIEERPQLQTFKRFVDLVLRPDSSSLPITESNSQKIRAYGIVSWQDGISAAYVFHHESHTTPATGLTITLNVPQSGKGYWLDPSTGQIVSSFSIQSGNQVITIPSILVDLVFFTLPSSYDIGDVPPIAVVDVDNPQWIDGVDEDLDNDGIDDYGPDEPPFGKAPLPLTFDAGASTDWDGGSLTYVWTFHDGSTSTGAIASYTYTQRGNYPVMLEVTDDEGLSAEFGLWVRVFADPNPTVDDPPVFDLVPDISVREGNAFFFVPTAFNNGNIVGGSYNVNTLKNNHYSFSGQLPVGAIYDQTPHEIPNPNYILPVFFWIPDFNQHGDYALSDFVATDPENSFLTDTLVVDVTVDDVIAE